LFSRHDRSGGGERRRQGDRRLRPVELLRGLFQTQLTRPTHFGRGPCTSIDNATVCYSHRRICMHYRLGDLVQWLIYLLSYLAIFPFAALIMLVGQRENYCKRKTLSVSKKYTQRTVPILSMIYSISVCTTAQVLKMYSK